MPRVLAVAAVVLLLVSLAAPGLEAFSGCATPCPDDDEAGRCSDGLCCSCCTYAAPATVRPSAVFRPGEVTADRIAPAAMPLPDGEGRGLLHVPKPILF